jgi:hypothetical protein
MEDLQGRLSVRFVFLLSDERLKLLIGSGFEYQPRKMAETDEVWSSLVTVPQTVSVLDDRFLRDLNGYRLLAHGSVSHFIESLELLKSLSSKTGSDIERGIAVVIFSLDKQIWREPRISLSGVPIQFENLSSILDSSIALDGVKFSIDSSTDRDNFWASIQPRDDQTKSTRLSMTVSKPTIEEMIGFLRLFPQVMQSILSDFSGE